MSVLPQERIAFEQQIHQILHNLVEGLVVFAFGDNLELELIHHRFVHTQQVEVFRCRQESTNLSGLLQEFPPLCFGIIYTHIVECIFLLVGHALSRWIVK